MTERDRRLRSAVIGTGFVGPFHVDAARRGGFADVVAIAGTSEERTAGRARELGVPAWTTDVAALIADPTIDVVHICTPNRTHVELASAALEARKHIVLEKPIALDSAGARSLVALARRVGRHAAVALTYRGYPMVRRARTIVAAGEVGPVRLIHGGYISDWLADPDVYNWRVEPKVSGPSRAVADIGTHWFDLAEFVTGLRVEAVLGDLATFIPQRRRPPAGVAVAWGLGSGTADGKLFDVHSEDAATILFRFTGGARGACVVSQVSPGHKNACTIEVAGSNQTIAWGQEEPERLWIGGREESRVLTRGPRDAGGDPLRGIPPLPAGHPEGWAEALRDVLRPFYAAIASGAPPPDPGEATAYPTLEDGARGVAFIEAVLRSADEGRWTPIAQ